MTKALFGFAMILLASANDHGPSTEDLVNAGNSAWGRGDFLAAAESYERASDLTPDSPEPSYNLALAYYRLELYEQSIRYLDKAQARAQGELRGRCLLLRADIEYRRALAEKPERRVEGLERALVVYREALAASGGSAALAGIARYDIEVVKLRLPVARDSAPGVNSSDAEQDTSADDAADETGGQDSKRRGQTKQEDRDW